jgi:tetratricopeptide (TPR) repeat protein
MTESEAKALADLNERLRQNPNDAWMLAQRGEIYRLSGCYTKALMDFNDALARQPNYAWALAHRGETYCLMGAYGDALTDFDQAIALRPTYTWAAAHRGVLFRLMGRYSAALADFDHAFALKPDYTWVITQRGNTYMRQKRYTEALADLDRVVALDETFIPHWRGERGLILNAMGRYGETVVCCEQALQKHKKDHIALYSLVVARHLWQGSVAAQAEREQTRKLLQAILQTALPGDVQAGALYRLSGLAALEGQREQALTYLQRGISLDHEPRGLAHYDPAWQEMWVDPQFQALIAENGF